MTTNKHRLEIDKWIDEQIRPSERSYNERLLADIVEAVYTMNKLGMWPECEQMSVDDVIKAWEMVEAVREHKGFPFYLSHP